MNKIEFELKFKSIAQELNIKYKDIDLSPQFVNLQRRTWIMKDGKLRKINLIIRGTLSLGRQNERLG